MSQNTLQTTMMPHNEDVTALVRVLVEAIH